LLSASSKQEGLSGLARSMSAQFAAELDQKGDVGENLPVRLRVLLGATTVLIVEQPDSGEHAWSGPVY
jgi:hypothetical protein